jgi:phosphoglycerate dehydrogenase-like enzyme
MCSIEFHGLDKLYEVAARADYFVCVAPSTPDNSKC